MSYFNTLGKEILEINRANGWEVTTPGDWGRTYKIPAVLALIHSEVSEALLGFFNGDIANFREEIADIAIRVLDMAAGLKINMDEEADIENILKGSNITRPPLGIIIPNDWEMITKLPAELSFLNLLISNALEAFRKDDRGAFDAAVIVILLACYDLAAALRFDLESEIDNKLSVNKTRGRKHGGKRV